MERITNKRIEDFPPATLYLNDLSEIVGVMAQACSRIEIKAGDYKITDASELDALAAKFPSGRFDDIYLQGYGPYISIDLRTYAVSAYISEDTLEQRGIVSKVRDIVNSGKKRNPGWLFGALSNIAVAIGMWQILVKEYYVGALLIFLSLATIPFSVKPCRVRTAYLLRARDSECIEKVRGAYPTLLSSIVSTSLHIY